VTTAALSLDGYLSALRADVDAALERVLAARAGVGPIDAPVRYALLGPGKRLRPCLTLAVADSVAASLGVDAATARARARPAACAVEMIHAYSLAHDDLPAMDDDDLRRGRPTTHVVYGEGLAVLAGDGLLTEAFGVLAEWPSAAAGSAVEPGVPADRLRAVAALAASAGMLGMVGGQAIDLAAAAGRETIADVVALEDMHARKTGALIRAACTLGAIVNGAPAALVAAIDAYARDLGLAFQIIDDVLDVEGSNDALGKTAGKDAAAGKPTFPAFFGAAGSRARAADCIGRALTALADAGLDGRLGEIARWSLARTR
jgi:geranylgeranyl pyrophosphate synthase